MSQMADVRQRGALQRYSAKIWSVGFAEPTELRVGILSHSLSLAGFSSGQLQKLLKDMSQSAGMSATLCMHAKWWQLHLVMSALSTQAAAGVRLELMPLMKASCREIDGVRPTQSSLA